MTHKEAAQVGSGLVTSGGAAGHQSAAAREAQGG